MTDMHRRKFLQTAGGFGALSLMDHDTKSWAQTLTPALAQIPAASPQAQDELEKTLGNVQPTNDLDLLIHRVVERIPTTLPQARNVPPQPKIYFSDGDGIAVSGHMLQDPEKGTASASAIVITKKAKDTLGEDELRFGAARALGEMVMTLNPGLAQSLPLPVENAVKKDLNNLRLSLRTSPELFKKYMDDLVADDLAIHLTRDPVALVSFHDKTTTGSTHVNSDTAGDIETRRAEGRPSEEARKAFAYKVKEQLVKMDLERKVTPRPPFPTHKFPS